MTDAVVTRTGLVGRLAQVNGLLAHVPASVVLLAARVFPAVVFWQSARTKVEGFAIRDATYFLFEHEYALPLIPHRLAAQLATLAEHVLPVLLILGFCGRLSALGLLTMTAVIQIFVYPGAWVTHGLWAACLLAVVAFGPGRIAVDPLIGLEPAENGKAWR